MQVPCYTSPLLVTPRLSSRDAQVIYYNKGSPYYTCSDVAVLDTVVKPTAAELADAMNHVSH